jgi:hypothetical protein
MPIGGSKGGSMRIAVQKETALEEISSGLTLLYQVVAFMSQ